MAFGMGLNFVPVTLTAVHHLRAEESGIGSGVLNTMQQVGGALGLAVLGTVAMQTFTDRGKEFAAAAARPAQGQLRRSRRAVRRDRAAADLRRGLDPRLPGRLDPDARRLGGGLDLPRRQARGARDRRAPRASACTDPPLAPAREDLRRRRSSLRRPRPSPIRSHRPLRRRRVSDPHLTTYDAPGRPARDGPGAARRQAALAPGRRRPQRLVAPCRCGSPARSRSRAHEAGVGRVAASATASAAGTAARDRWPTPAGRSTGSAPSTATCRSSCSATRWAPASRSTPPTTRRWWASSGSRRGGRPTTRSHTLAGRTLRAAHGRRDRITSFRETARYVERARHVADSAELEDMGALGHYMLTGSAPLARRGDRVGPRGRSTRTSLPRALSTVLGSRHVAPTGVSSVTCPSRPRPAHRARPDGRARLQPPRPRRASGRRAASPTSTSRSTPTR